MTPSNKLCVSKIFERTTDYKRTPYLLDTANTSSRLSARATVQFQGQLQLPHPSCSLAEPWSQAQPSKPSGQMTLSRRTMSSYFWLDLHFDWRVKLLYYWQYKLKNGTTNSYKNINYNYGNFTFVHLHLHYHQTTHQSPQNRLTQKVLQPSPEASAIIDDSNMSREAVSKLARHCERLQSTQTCTMIIRQLY